MDEVRKCKPEDRCPDMIRVNTMLKMFLGGIAVLLVSALLSVFFQWRGATAQIETSIAVLELTKSFNVLSDSVHNLFTRVDSIENRQRRQSYDGQRTRSHINKIGKKLGVDPIEVRPFNPPTYEDMERNYNKQEKGK